MVMDVDARVEYGVVATLRNRFGFIKCCQRKLDLFFHFHDLEGGIEGSDLSPGLEVSAWLRSLMRLHGKPSTQACRACA